MLQFSDLTKRRKLKPQFNSDKIQLFHRGKLRNQFRLYFRRWRNLCFPYYHWSVKLLENLLHHFFLRDRDALSLERHLIWWKIRYPSILARSNSFDLMKFSSLASLQTSAACGSSWRFILSTFWAFCGQNASLVIGL